MPHATLEAKPPRAPLRLNCETTAEQSASGKRGGKAKLDANQIEALWDAVQAHRAATFRWTPPAD